MSARPLTMAEIYDLPVVWVLSVTWAGRTWYLGTDEVRIADQDGGVINVAGVLEAPDWVVALDLFSVEPESASLPFEVLWPDDVAELVAQGHDPSLATAELAMWVEGRTWEERLIVLSGVVTEPEFGATGEPFAFTLAARELTSSRVWPSATEVVDSTTWPDAPFVGGDPVNDGAVYPQVIDRPGRWKRDGEYIYSRGTPAYLVEASGAGLASCACLVAGHECGAGDVTIQDVTASGQPTDVRAVETITDGRGRKVAVVYLDGAGSGGAMDVDDGSHRYMVYWNGSGGSDATGLQRTDRSGPVRGAGEVIQRFLELGDSTVDWGAWEPLVDRLNAFLLAGFVDAPVVPLDFVRREILPLLPLSLASGPVGIYPVWWEPDARLRVAEWELIAPMDGSREGRVTMGPSDEVWNDFTIRFAYSPDPDGYRRSATLGAETSWLCDISQRRYGTRARKPHDTRMVTSDATASAILAWWAAAYAIPPHIRFYRCPPHMSAARPGSWGLITDGDSHLTSAEAWLKGIRYGSTGPTLEVWSWPTPLDVR